MKFSNSLPKYNRLKSKVDSVQKPADDFQPNLL